MAKSRTYDNCTSCNGSGKKKHWVTRDGKRVQITANCNVCGGTGKKKS